MQQENFSTPTKSVTKNVVSANAVPINFADSANFKDAGKILAARGVVPTHVISSPTDKMVSPASKALIGCGRRKVSQKDRAKFLSATFSNNKEWQPLVMNVPVPAPAQTKAAGTKRSKPSVAQKKLKTNNYCGLFLYHVCS